MTVLVEFLTEQIDVYDVTVDDNHNFFANGILVHNCTEIELATDPLQKFDDPEGLISLCTLSAKNWGNIKKPSDFEPIMRRCVFALDALLDYQGYPLQAARNSTEWYRPLGIGINDLAHFFAKNDVKYGEDSCLKLVDEYMEAMAYYGTKASIELAKKYGPCGLVANTKYGQGIVPCDVRKRTVDELVTHVERYDWDGLRADLKEYGIRNATLFAHMPSETSSKIRNLTNGIEPARGLVVSKDGTYIVVPEAEKLKNKYESAWDVDVENYLKVCAVIQKWTDQGISVNTTYDISKFPGEKIPGALVFRHLLLGYRWGIKAFYYNNNAKPTYENDKPADDTTDVCESCAI